MPSHTPAVMSSSSSDKEARDAAYLEKVGTADTADSIDPQLERRVVRQFDTKVVPWLFGLWLLSFIDRSNIGNAKIDGLSKDLKLDSNKFNISLCVFYVPYIIVDLPSNWLVKRLNAGYYLPGLIFAWGIVSTFTGFVKSYNGLLVARFFLGLCEGGLLPGLILYLSMFYRRGEMLRRVGFFYCAAPLSGAIGGLLATGLSKIKAPGYHGWAFIFFVEGVLTVFYGLLACVYLPHTPGTAKFLTPAEQAIAVSRLQLDSHGASHSVESEAFSWHWVKMAILNWNTLLLSLNFFAIITPIYSYSLFLPTIISGMGYTSITANLLTVPPNALAVLTVLATGYASDHYQQRGAFMLAGLTLAAAGYIMLIATPNVHIQYGGTFLVAAGIFPCSPLVMGWLANNLAPHYVRATGTGAQIALANLAAFVATFTYLSQDAPRYVQGHAINLGMIGLGMGLTVVLIVYNRWENGRREKGLRDARVSEVGVEGEWALGHRHPKFRYTV